MYINIYHILILVILVYEYYIGILYIFDIEYLYNYSSVNNETCCIRISMSKSSIRYNIIIHTKVEVHAYLTCSSIVLVYESSIYKVPFITT